MTQLPNAPFAANLLDGGGAVINVKHPSVGAKGDGVTDDEPAIQAVLDALADGTGVDDLIQPTIYFPPGTYMLGKPLRIKMRETRLVGGQGRSTRFRSTYAYGPMIVGYPVADTPGGTQAYPDVSYDQVYPAGGSFPPNPGDRIVLDDALATGAGFSFRISPLGTGKRMHFFNLRDCAFLNLDGLAQLCVETFVNLDATGNGGVLASSGKRHNYEDVTQAFTIRVSNGVLIARLTLGGTVHDLAGTTVLVTDTTYHVALTYDGSTIRLFLDGAVEASKAATGTITQNPWEDVTTGIVMAQWPEAGSIDNSIDGRLDSIRFSNAARYTAPFTKPTAKFTLDANTLVLLNFDDNYDAFTVGQTNDGDAHFFMRAQYLLAGAFLADVTLKDLWLAGDEGSAGGRCGVILKAAIRSHMDRIFVRSRVFGILLYHDCFLSSSERIQVQIFSGGRFGLGLGAAHGVYNALHPRLTGGVYPLVAVNGSGTYEMAWLESSSDSHSCALVEGAGGVGPGGTFLNTIFNAESGGAGMEYGLLVGKADVHLVGGTFEAWQVPAVRIEGSHFTAIGTRFQAHQDSVAPVISIGQKPESRVLLIAPIKRIGLTTENPNDWTDQPKHLQLWDNGRIRPLVGGCHIIEQADLTTIDAARAAGFAIVARTATVINVPSPSNLSAGQEITITIYNKSGGALGGTTFGLAYTMGAWVDPADGFNRSITFRYSSLGLVEVSRTADIANPNYPPGAFADLLWHVDAEGIGGLADEDPVASWPDETAGGNDADQATGSLQPLWQDGFVNGQAAVQFDGVDDTLKTPNDASLDIEGPLSLFVVARAEAATVTLVQKASGGSEAWRASITAARFPSISITTSTGVVAVTAEFALTLGQFYILSYVHDGTTLRIYVDGVLVKEQDVGVPVEPGFPAHRGVILGGDGLASATHLNGYLGDVALYDRALADDERQQLEVYLGDKYGIPVGAAC